MTERFANPSSVRGPRAPRRGECTATRCARRSRRRGFALILAIGVFALATLTVAWNMRRIAVYTATTRAQTNAYTQHHEELAIADICRVWVAKLTGERLSPGDTPNGIAERTLASYANSPEADFEMLMPDGDLITFFLRDGQGSVLANLGRATTPEQQQVMLSTLVRLPADRPELIRAGGPFRVSLRAAPPEVIRAAAGDDLRLAEALREARADPSVNDANLRTTLARAGIPMATADPVVAMFTLEPTVWLVDVEVRNARSVGVDPGVAAARGDVRWYQFLMQEDSVDPILLERRRLTREQFERSRAQVIPDA